MCLYFFFQTSNVPAIKTIGDVLRRHPERLFRYNTDLKAMYRKVNDHTVLIQVSNL